MKKLCLMFTLMFTVMLAACSSELSQEDVVDKLSQHLEDSSSYYATGAMEVDSNGELYKYNVEIAYQQPNYYKVTLKNETTNNEQIILKNDEGVYVLTPALNKQFKFQSDWPLSSSQVYLYQSILKDILSDEKASFTSTEEGYIFENVANYHGNRELVTQKVMLDKKDLLPTEVIVMDESSTPRIKMSFTSFKWNEKFEDGYFDCQKTMSYSQDELGEGVTESVSGAVYPAYLPDGTKLVNEQVEAADGGSRVIMTFDGEKGFTVIQEPVAPKEAVEVESLYGEPIMVNGSIVALADNSITWIDGSTEFFVVSDNLDKDELLAVYDSMNESMVK